MLQSKAGIHNPDYVAQKAVLESIEAVEAPFDRIEEAAELLKEARAKSSDS
jgi:hypothetical protein